MDKIELKYRIKKMKNMLHDYTTIDRITNLECCMEEVAKILDELVERLP